MTYTTCNPVDYTAEKCVEDIAAVLPFAVSELHRLNRMTTCAHCGGTHDGICFSIQKSDIAEAVTDVEVVAVCDECVSAVSKLPPKQWKYVCETSRLLVATESWAAFAKNLRSLGALALCREWGLPLVSKRLHADVMPNATFTGVVFFGVAHARLLEMPCGFPWEPNHPSFAGGGITRDMLEAALCHSAMTKLLGACVETLGGLE